MAERKASTSSPTPAAASRGLTAAARFVRIGPRKVRLLADQLRGMPFERAIDQLRFVNKSAAAPLEKLLRSAAANVRAAGQFEPKDLRIAVIIVEAGPKLKRFMPRAHGRATEVLQRMSHVRIVLAPVAGVSPGTPAQPRAEGRRPQALGQPAAAASAATLAKTDAKKVKPAKSAKSAKAKTA